MSNQPFGYRTTGDVYDQAHPVYVSNIPQDLVWGMRPLGWRYVGHSSHGYFGEPYDAWAPPYEVPDEEKQSSPHGHWSLHIPRAIRPGQYEITFGYTPPYRTMPDQDDLGTPMPTRNIIWSANITTTAELNTRLLEVHALAADLDALAAYTALTLAAKAQRR